MLCCCMLTWRDAGIGWVLSESVRWEFHRRSCRQVCRLGNEMTIFLFFGIVSHGALALHTATSCFSAESVADALLQDERRRIKGIQDEAYARLRAVKGGNRFKLDEFYANRRFSQQV